MRRSREASLGPDARDVHLAGARKTHGQAVRMFGRPALPHPPTHGDDPAVARRKSLGSARPILLLPRQALAASIGDAELLELEREDFVTAVAGHGRASHAALTVTTSYGGSLSLGGS